MKQLPLGTDDATILAAVHDWVALLVEERYREAYDYLSHDRGDHWSPHLIETVIHNYGSVEPLHDGTMYRVTPLETATGGPTPRHEVDRFDDARAHVWFDLPLNGQWSDLTATLFVNRSDDSLVLILDDIHVM